MIWLPNKTFFPSSSDIPFVFFRCRDTFFLICCRLLPIPSSRDVSVTNLMHHLELTEFWFFCCMTLIDTLIFVAPAAFEATSFT